MKILIIEDNPSVRQLIVMALDFMDCEVFEAVNGRSGLDLYNAHKPDVVLLDVMMPGGLDGLEVCKAIRADTRHRCKIVMLSAKAQLVDQFDGLMAGADEYIAKPFSVTELLAKLQVLNDKS